MPRRWVNQIQFGYVIVSSLLPKDERIIKAEKTTYSSHLFCFYSINLFVKLRLFNFRTF